MKKYLVIYEWAGANWSAYSPDIPGCAAVGDTRPEVEINYREALDVWIDEMNACGCPIPEPRAEASHVSIAS